MIQKRGIREEKEGETKGPGKKEKKRWKSGRRPFWEGCCTRKTQICPASGWGGIFGDSEMKTLGRGEASDRVFPSERSAPRPEQGNPRHAEKESETFLNQLKKGGAETGVLWEEKASWMRPSTNKIVFGRGKIGKEFRIA